jgi:hypothetical protein
MKAQAWSMDLAASIVIFVTALALAMFALNYTMNQSHLQLQSVMMENAAMSASDSLVRQAGVPQDWTAATVTTIGLASRENVLDETKLQEFLGLDGNTTKELLGIGNYDYYFDVRYPNGTIASLPGGQQITKGSYPSSATAIIPAERHVIYMEDIARMRLILWI